MPEGEHFEYVEVQGREENFVPRTHIHFLSRLQESRDPPWGKLLLLDSLHHPAVCPVALVVVVM